jgi:crotonobetainyl-CoA:carnitine CoA-transferase CaiB-like acyl-CoA transferase
LREREYIREVEHLLMGVVRTMGAPFRLPDSPGGPVAPPPTLGEHNEEVYGALLGITGEDLEALRDEGVI